MVRLGSFFRVIVGATVALTIVAMAIAATGAIWPRAVPICFHPEDKGKVVCATGETRADINGAPLTGPGKGGDFDDGVKATVQLLGGRPRRRDRRPAGRGSGRGCRAAQHARHLDALQGPALARDAEAPGRRHHGGRRAAAHAPGIVPGLSALDSSAQIIAWAIIFGYAQQIVTGLIDRQAHGVLNDVRSRADCDDATRRRPEARSARGATSPRS